jgi:nicotinamidase-related amidase
MTNNNEEIQQQNPEGNMLLIIDAQNDFCQPDGPLFVEGAVEDCSRLADFIHDNLDQFKNICATLDSHFLLHVAHPLYWKEPAGDFFFTQVKPGTTITLEDFKTGKYVPYSDSEEVLEVTEYYLTELKNRGKNDLHIWPPHCLIGTEGHNIYPSVMESILEWQQADARRVPNLVMKGSNVYTEHFSVIEAEVPLPNDPTTQINFMLIGGLISFERIFIAGQAKSHCVAATVRDIISCFNEMKSEIEQGIHGDLPNIQFPDIFILEDTMSSVGGFEKLGDDFIEEMKATEGVVVTNSKEFKFNG